MDDQNRRRRWIIVILLLIIVIPLLYWLSTIFNSSRNSLSTEIIPDDVAMVFAIDLPQIIYESDFQQIQQSKSYLEYLNKASLENPIFAAVIKDPINAGVSIDRDYFFVFDKDTTLNLEDFSALIVPLKDEAAFTEIVKSRKQSSKTILEENGFKYYEVDQLTAIAWNKDNAVFGAAKSFVSLPAKMDRFFSTKPSRSVMNDRQFQEVMESDADIAFWISTSAYANDKAVLQKFALDQLPHEIVSGNYITGAVNFGKGEIDGTANFKFKPELRGGFDNFFIQGSKTEIYDYFPGGDVTLLLSSNLNLPKILYRGLNDEKLLSSLESFLAKKDLKLDDLLRMFTGNITLATYAEGPDARPALTLALELDNKDKLNSLLAIGQQENIVRLESPNQYQLISTGGAVKTNTTGITFPDNMMRIYLTEDYLFLTSSQRILQSLKAGKAPKQERLDDDITDQFNSFLVAGYSDISKTSSPDQQTLKMSHVKFNLDKDKLSFTLALENKNEYALKEIFLSPN